MWEENFARLKQYKAEHGTTRVKKKRDNGLFAWVARQRQRCEIGAVPPLGLLKTSRLKELGFETVIVDPEKVGREV